MNGDRERRRATPGAQPSTPYSHGENASDADMVRLIRWYFGPGEAEKAVHYAYTLSGMNALAFGRLTPDAVGLFQLEPEDVGFDKDAAWLLHNPIRNVAAAYRIWKAHGWAMWNDRLRRRNISIIEWAGR